jgi:hypothetical protein
VGEILSYRRVGNLERPNNIEWRRLRSPACPYCGERRFSGQPSWVRDVLPSILIFGECENCGWWYAVQDASLCNDDLVVIAGGVLERFDMSHADTPVQVLREEVRRHIRRISEVHPRKMEELVGSILAGVHDCEVHYLGYSKDGGIDLILLIGEHRIAVQVKRRESVKKREGVSVIREFLSASLLAGHSDLMFVTSADEFTSGAARAAKAAVRQGLVERYELISRDQLRSLLNSNRGLGLREALQAAVDIGDCPTIPNPFLYGQLGRNSARSSQHR